MIIVNREGLGVIGTAHVLFPWWANGPQRIAYCVENGISLEEAEKAEADYKSMWTKIADDMPHVMDELGPAIAKAFPFLKKEQEQTVESEEIEEPRQDIATLLLQYVENPKNGADTFFDCRQVRTSTLRAAAEELRKLRATLLIIRSEAKREDVNLVHLKKCAITQANFALGEAGQRPNP